MPTFQHHALACDKRYMHVSALYMPFHVHDDHYPALESNAVLGIGRYGHHPFNVFVSVTELITYPLQILYQYTNMAFFTLVTNLLWMDTYIKTLKPDKAYSYITQINRHTWFKTR